MNTDIKQNKSEFEYLKEIIVFLLKYWYCFVISLLICSIIAFIYLQNKKPVFSIISTVTLRHDESLGGGAASMSKSKSVLSAFGFSRGSENIEDESIKMASQGYVKKVIKELQLNADYKQSSFLGLNKIQLHDKSPIVINTDPHLPDTLSAILEFVLNIKDNVTTVKLKNGRKTIGTYSISSFPAFIQTPFGEFSLYKTKFFDYYHKPLKLNVLFTSYDFMAQIYRTMLEVDFEKKTSDLINLRILSDDIKTAKQFLNSIIDFYNREWNVDRDTVTNKTNEYIDRMIKTTYHNLNEADLSIRNFKDRYKLTDIKADVTYYFTASSELQPVIMETESRLKMIDIILDFIKDDSNKYSMLPYNVSSEESSLTEITLKYNELLSKRNELYSAPEQGSMAKTIDIQIDEQRKVLLQSIYNLRKGLEITLKDLKLKDKEFTEKLGNVPSIEQDFIQLKRNQEIQQTVYLTLLEMQIENGVKGTTLLPKLKVIDEPFAEIKPVEPNMLKVLLTTVLLGAFIVPVSFIYFVIPSLKKRSKRNK
jgi:hypothetical protein